MERKPSIALDGVFGDDKYLEFVKFSSREHHFGSPEVPTAGQPFRVTLNKGISYPYPVYVHAARDRYILRRTLGDIRLEPAEVHALSIVESGSMIVNQGGATLRVSANEMVLIPMTRPYLVEHIPPENASFKVIYGIFPSRLVDPQRRFPERPKPINVPTKQIEAITAILRLLYSHGDTLGYSYAQAIFESLLNQIASIKISESEQPLGTPEVSQTSDDRWHQALSYIYMMSSNRLLNAEAMARAIGISTRSLVYLFNQHGTTFSRVLWDFRLSLVRDWLLAPAMQHVPIQQLAYAAGFKSSAHLSTLFKERMKCLPRDMRAAAKAEHAQTRNEAEAKGESFDGLDQP